VSVRIPCMSVFYAVLSVLSRLQYSIFRWAACSGSLLSQAGNELDDHASLELTARVPHGASVRQPKKSNLAERLVVSVSDCTSSRLPFKSLRESQVSSSSHCVVSCACLQTIPKFPGTKRSYDRKLHSRAPGDCRRRCHVRIHLQVTQRCCSRVCRRMRHPSKLTNAFLLAE